MLEPICYTKYEKFYILLAPEPLWPLWSPLKVDSCFLLTNGQSLSAIHEKRNVWADEAPAISYLTISLYEFFYLTGSDENSLSARAVPRPARLAARLCLSRDVGPNHWHRQIRAEGLRPDAHGRVLRLRSCRAVI